MKKIILLAFTTLMMVGCGTNSTNSTNNAKVKAVSNCGINIIEIDSCEYIISHVYGGQVIIHKPNCRFCKERRQKEVEELVIKLKENNYDNF